jgi:hypothetical protein
MNQHCGEAHGSHITKLEQHGKSIDSLWTAHDKLNETVTQVLIKVGTIVGASTALQVAIMIGLQFYFKKG